MSYVNRAQDPRRKASAIAGVVAVHVLAGAVLVNGLSYVGVANLPDRIKTTFIPDTPDPPPPPPPTDEIVPDTKAPDLVAPKPVIDLTPIGPVDPRPLDPLDIQPPQVIATPAPGLVDPPRPHPFAPKRAAPRGDTSRWVTPDDYPSRELRMGIEGTTHFRVVIGTDGRVATCEVTGSSGNERLDAATCRNIERRARFEPATDGNGQKVVGTYTNSVRWRIPD